MKLFALTLASFSLLASAPVLAASSLVLQLRGKPGGRSALAVDGGYTIR